MQHGPIDVVVIAAGEPKFDGKIAAELVRLASAGTIRVVDAMVIFKGENGSRHSLNIEDLPPDQAAALGYVDTGTRGLFDSADADLLFEGMVPGSAVVALAIEHAWAVGLKTALLESGAEVGMMYRVPGVIVDEAFAALEADHGLGG
jgi:hypothetical protein